MFKFNAVDVKMLDMLGEELSAEARIVFDDLHQQLMSLNTLPLSITNVYGLSPVLRGTEVCLLLLYNF